MKQVQGVCVCIALLALAFAGFGACIFLVRLSDAAGALTETARAVPSELRETRAQLLQRVDHVMPAIQGLPPLADHRLAAIQGDLVGQIQGLRQDLKPLLGETKTLIADTNQRIGETQASLNETILELHGTLADLHPEAKGLIRDSRLTAAEVARSSIYVRQQLPEFLTTWQGIGRNVETTTEASAKASEAVSLTMSNFAAATKPLPKWVRIGLAIAPPVAQAGAAAVGAGVALGWLGR